MVPITRSQIAFAFGLGGGDLSTSSLVWKVPAPVPPTEHGYKYRAAYVVNGVRVVGFDNEYGKGDHCHLDGFEVHYVFVSVEQLVEDFIAAVAARRAP